MGNLNKGGSHSRFAVETCLWRLAHRLGAGKLSGRYQIGFFRRLYPSLAAREGVARAKREDSKIHT